ncbi:MAG: SAM-dependent methyltransferase [Congregibacter sp.]|jgi:SAM-dependent methyltransferase
MKNRQKQNNLDDAFYLDQVNPTPPKEYFKFIADMVDDLSCELNSWHDIGCGSGEFINYLSARFSGLKVSGSDVSPQLIQMAKEKYPNTQFSVEDFTDVQASSILPSNDVISLIGVNGRFRYIDDWLPQFTSYIKDGGYGLIFDLFNPEPVDVAVSASKAESQVTEYDNTYFNLVSTTSVINKLDSIGFKTSFHRFEMPFELAKQNDPFRSWTIDLANGKRMLTNGLGQIFDLYLCVVYK